jgi:RNA polymerase sigma factor (sigma-70 family)
MSDLEVHSYLLQYIKEKFSPNSRFMTKVPEHFKEDTVNEIFIDLWKNRLNYNPQIADYTTYAYNRGRHVVKMMIGQFLKTKRICDKVKEKPAQQKRPLVASDRIEMEDDLRSINLRLTPHEREIVKMRFYEDKTVSEIAKTKNCSPQKIYQTLSGLKRLASI